MVKVRPTTPEEEAEFDIEIGDIKQAVEDGEIKDGDPEQLAQFMLQPGVEVVISDQVQEFLKSEGISEDEFIASLLKEGNREQ